MNIPENLTVWGWLWQKGRNHFFAEHNGTTPIPSTGSPTTAKMYGMGSVFKFTPKFSGKIIFKMTANAVYTSGTACACVAQLCYGTGAAPANNAALAGTVFGYLRTRQTFASDIAMQSDFEGQITGLTLNTEYWFDAQIRPTAYTTPTASTAALTGMQVIIEEI